MKFPLLIKKLNTSKRPLFAVLIDPDKFNSDLIRLANICKVDCFLIGGSVLEKGDINKTILAIKKISAIPVVLFPGDETQLSKQADGLFLPSLLSGRNPDYLIGKQILMSPIIKRMKLQHLPMAYLLINGNRTSATQKVTNTPPLDAKNKKLILHTAMAAELLGFKLIYLEAGSGAKTSVPNALVKEIKKTVSIPVIVGGGIDSKAKMQNALKSGANMIVVGNALENNPNLLAELSACFTFA